MAKFNGQIFGENALSELDMGVYLQALLPVDEYNALREDYRKYQEECMNRDETPDLLAKWAFDKIKVRYRGE